MAEVFGQELGGGQQALYTALGGSLFFGAPQERVTAGAGPYQVQRGVAELGQRWSPQQGRYIGQDEDYRNILMGQARQATHAAAAAGRGEGLQAAGPDTAAADQAREMQMQHIRGLGRVAGGTQRSYAENVMRDATRRQMRTARSLAVSQQGMSPAARLRAAQEAGSQIGAQGAQQASMVAAQQQQAAQQAQAQALAGLRGQDIGVMGQQQALGLANLQASMGQQQMAQQRHAQMMGMAMGMDQATAQRRMQLEMAQAQAAEGYEQRALQAQMANQQQQPGGILGGLFG